MVIGLEECGCEIHQDHDARVRIEYCPKHKAVGDLYEALEKIRSMTPETIIYDIANTALLKAEGGK